METHSEPTDWELYTAALTFLDGVAVAAKELAVAKDVANGLLNRLRWHPGLHEWCWRIMEERTLQEVAAVMRQVGGERDALAKQKLAQTAKNLVSASASMAGRSGRGGKKDTKARQSLADVLTAKKEGRNED